MSGAREERLANLVAFLLDVARPVTLRRIVGEVKGYPPDHQSARTQFLRDKDELAKLGITVEVSGVNEEAGYRIDPATYYLRDLGLDEEETVALNAAAATLWLEGDDPDDVFLRLGGPGVDAPPLVALPSDDRLGVLHEAVTGRRTVSFRYNAAERDVDPYGLLSRDGFWYLVGHDHLRGEVRNFRVDRIEGDVIAGDEGVFAVPDGFDLERALATHAWELAPGDAVTAVVRVDAAAAARVLADLGEEAVRDRHPDGAVTVELAVTNPAGLRSWLLGLLDHARLLGPPELVDDLTAWLRSMAESR